MEYLVPLLITSVLILLNALFVSAEFAIVAVPKTKIIKLAEEGSVAASRVLEVLNSPELQNRYLTTAQVGITIVSLGLGMYGEHVLAEWLIKFLQVFGTLTETFAHSISILISVGMLTYLHVVIGEMIPKSLALQTAESTVIALNRPMFIIERLFFPLVITLNKISVWITKIIGVPTADLKSRLFTPDELEFIAKESFEGGLLQPPDQLFIENILDLEERSAEQIMTPRNRIWAIPVNARLDEAMKIINQTTKTRYPVYEETLDQIIGILHIKDLARFIAHKIKDLNLRELVRTTIFIPESLPLDDLLIRFRRENHQIAIVIDEFGGTAGIVTLEDLVEEVVGEIQDEFDEETLPIEELPGNILRVRGDVLLAELEQHYNLEWKYPETNTIGGLVMSLLGEIAQPDDQVLHKGVKIIVESTEGLAVKSVLLFLPPEEKGTKINQV